MELPLKAAMSGVELLVDRAQLWEQSAAKYVSIAAELQALAALARRWRRLELGSWHSLLGRVRNRHAAGQSESHVPAPSMSGLLDVVGF